MEDIRYLQRLENYQRALALLVEATATPPSSLLERDGIIQRFEFTFELAWKTLQDICVYRGYDGIIGPRLVIEQSFSDGIISDGPLWFEMLRSRNETAHIYDETIVVEIVRNISTRYVSALSLLATTISSLPH